MPQYLTGLVIRKNNEDFIGDVGVVHSGASILSSGIGVIVGDIPVPGNSNGGASIDGDFWAIPVNYGTVAGFRFLPYNPATGGVNSVKPDVQAFPVFKLSLTPDFGSDYWYVYGTVAQYLTASGGGAALPVTLAVSEAPCQTLCNQNPTSGLFIGNLGIPNLTSNQRLFPYGYFNGVALPAGSANGYNTPALLLTFLNTAVTGWAAVGTWTLSADNLTAIVTQAAGPGTDTLCAAIVTINPSA